MTERDDLVERLDRSLSAMAHASGEAVKASWRRNEILTTIYCKGFLDAAMEAKETVKAIRAATKDA